MIQRREYLGRNRRLTLCLALGGLPLVVKGAAAMDLAISQAGLRAERIVLKYDLLRSELASLTTGMEFASPHQWNEVCFSSPLEMMR